jgi:hypothetical protein
MPARRRVARRVAAALLLATALAAAQTGCSSPPSHFTRLWVQGHTGAPAIGVSTEGGILTLSSPGWKVGDRFDLQFPHGNSLVNDVGIVDRLNETVTIILPATARLSQGRFADSLPSPEETLYLAVRDEWDEPAMREVELWRDGEYGDWVLLPGVNEYELEQIATQYRGTGIYVERDGRWEIVGMLAGLLASDEADPRGEVALGYIGLTELARILPRQQDILKPDLRPLRPDFEFGVPLQPGDLVIEPTPGGEPTDQKPPAPEPEPPPR